ncbi:MAG: cytochrome c [Armatimonadetes bacterium]|nr:cytochrome c [Armatimonadota bacterium]
MMHLAQAQIPPHPPVAYYNAQCARCHGPGGSFYGPTLGKGKNDAQLREVIRQMCEGQGGMPLQGIDLEAQLAYHRAIIRREPFVCVTLIKPGRLAGEVYDAKSITLQVGSKRFAGRISGDGFSVIVPKGLDARGGTITAIGSKGSKSVLPVKAIFGSRNPLR